MKRSLLYLTAAAAAILISSCASAPKQEAQVTPADSGTEQVTQASEQKDLVPDSSSLRKIPCINNSVPQGSLVLLDGFEEELYWAADGEYKTDDYSSYVQISEEWASYGSNSLQVELNPVPQKSFASFSCESLITKNWANAEFIICDINNTTQNPLYVIAEVQGGREHNVSVTKEVAIGIGVNTNVCFDLRHQVRDASGMEIPGIQDDDNIRTVTFRIAGKSCAGTVFFDNINISGKDL